jgi:nitrite reductase/ring-hydroxylating ferredoxin subunit
MNRLCDLDSLPEHGAREFSAGQGDLFLVRTPAGVNAYRNVCPHQGRSMNFAPGEFLFTPDGLLVCPHHGARFDPLTGECTDGPCKGASLSPLAVRIEDGAVWLPESPEE